MGKATVIPFGPQHPVLPEPLHLDLVVQDETVVDVLPQIGFVHRGLEMLVETRGYNEVRYICERVGGFGAEGAAGAPGAEGALGAAGAPASGADSDAGSIPSRLVLQKGHFFGSSP